MLHPPGTALVRTLTGHTDLVTGVALSGDARLAVSASLDKTLKVWDLESGRELQTLTGHMDEVLGRGADAWTDGWWSRRLGDWTLKVWDLASGRTLRTLSGHSRKVRAVAVTQDGRRGVSASNDQTLKVWDLRSGRELYTLSGALG